MSIDCSKCYFEDVCSYKSQCDDCVYYFDYADEQDTEDEIELEREQFRNEWMLYLAEYED